MKVRVSEKDIEFTFTDVVDALKFDDGSHGLSHCMSAVDFIVELKGSYVFIEVKDPDHPKATPQAVAEFCNEIKSGELRMALVKKYRDSFLYRWAEEKLDKPVNYAVLLCMNSMDKAMLLNENDLLKRELPLQETAKWQKQIAASCNIFNIDTWNKIYPKMSVRRISAS